MQSSIVIALGLTVLPVLSAAPAKPDDFEQRAPHEHGKVTINAALDGKKLVIELDSPAVNVVGFEHEPRTDAERTAVREASDLLNSGRGLLGTPKEASCVFQRTELKAPQWESSTETQGSHDEHEHHADYEARLAYRCDVPGKLTWLEPWLVDKLLNVTEARLNIVAASGQRSEVVRTGHVRVALP